MREYTQSEQPVVYQIYVRSFADANGDGIGDLEGIRTHLWHVDKLGADGVWITPFYRSPQHDAGYDISDHTDVDPLFGDLADFERLVTDAHAQGLMVFVDIVPNHVSSEHPWFQALLAGDSQTQAYFHVLPGRGADGGQPPNNWVSMFGGPAWSQLPDGRWYLHLFDSSQPDLDWTNPAVRAEFERILTTWADRGADGFRIDVAAGLIKDPAYPDYGTTVAHPHWGRPEVHQIYRQWDAILHRDDRSSYVVAEVWGSPEEVMAYAGPGELDSAFAFPWLASEFDAASLQGIAEEWLAAADTCDAVPSWVLGSHDFIRPVTRYGGGELGWRRARAMALVTFALPGAVYIHQGEELGLPEVEVPAEARQDPTFHRTDGEQLGRDGVRVPLPWAADEPHYGFSAAGSDAPWLPQPPAWRELAVDAQWRDSASTLALYRAAIALRRTLLLPASRAVTWLDLGEGILAFRRAGVLVCLNTSGAAIPMPPGRLLLTSSPFPSGTLPANSAVWILE